MSGETYYYLKTVGGPQVTGEKLERLWRLAYIVKQARDALDPEPIISHLAEDAVYETQEHIEPITGKSAIASYLEKRFAFFRSLQAERDTGTMIPAVVDLPRGSGHPCLIFFADGKRHALWVVTPDDDGKIDRIGILTIAPHPSEARALDQKSLN